MKRGVIFSPNTIQKMAGAQLAVPPAAADAAGKKALKPRKRKNKSDKTTSQTPPKPMRVQDEPPRYKDVPRVHMPGIRC